MRAGRLRRAGDSKPRRAGGNRLRRAGASRRLRLLLPSPTGARGARNRSPLRTQPPPPLPPQQPLKHKIRWIHLLCFQFDDAAFT